MGQTSPAIGAATAYEARLAPLDEVDSLSDDLHADYLEHYGVCPVQRTPGNVVVATWKNAVDAQALDDLTLRTRRRSCAS